MMRLRLRGWGLQVRPQVLIPPIGRVDMVVGDDTVLEVDSVAHHSGDDHIRDRQRDLALTALGWRVIRLTYRQIVHDWRTTAAHLRAILR